jgi:NAD(P)-dependent dehydrogenase (short-subunit alcohol dehydrogenase family)
MTSPVAVVTGGGGGIGHATVRRLKVDGYVVAVADLEDREGVTGECDLFEVVDASSQEGMDDFVADVEDRFGPVTAGVASAGVIASGPFLELDAAQLDRTFRINVGGPLYLTQAIGRRRSRDRHGASIVLVSSISGRSGRPREADYAASKAAVISLTKSASLALAEFGVRVNAVCPGVVETDMTRRLHRDRAERQAISEEESLAGMTRRIPLGRAGSPDEIAASVAWLLGPSSSYVTGQALNVCGGVEMD